MDEINYSIIIPHKNIPHLLQRCLKSIPRRKDVQIIIVDDNSDPEIVDFANFPGVLEECVEVYFTKEGKGAGFARNVGLEHAVGRWLIFADADDFFNACFLGSIDTYKDSLYDIVYFGVNSVFSDSLKVTNRDMRINKFVERAISLNDVNSLRFKLYGPVSKMVSRKLVETNSLYFEERIVANDIWFSITSGFYAQRVIADRTKIYCVTVREGSLELFVNRERCDERLSAAFKINDFLKSKGLLKYRFNVCVYLKFYSHFGFIVLVSRFIRIIRHYQGGYLLFMKDLVECFLKLFRKKNAYFKHMISKK